MSLKYYKLYEKFESSTTPSITNLSFINLL